MVDEQGGYTSGNNMSINSEDDASNQLDVVFEVSQFTEVSDTN
jgi:hypothetical protein